MIILHNIDYNAKIHDRLRAFIKERGIETSQAGVHFGNYCLINIPDDLLAEIRGAFAEGPRGIQYRNKKTILEAGDLVKYKAGDKITLEYLATDFFPVRDQKATVFEARDGRLTLRAYRAQNKGWHIRPGDECRISRGW